MAGWAESDLRPGGAFKGRTASHMVSMGLAEVAEMGTGGWTWILSDLKTVLEISAGMGA